MTLPYTTGQYQLHAVEREVRRAFFAETPALTGSQWAETYRYVSPEHNPEEPGPWRNARVPYLTEIMDALTDPDVERVVVRKSGRVGGTECLNNFIGYIIDQRPRPTLVMLPTDGDARDWSKESLDPLLRDTRRLRGRVWDSEVGRRRKSSTIQYKQFGGGYVAIVGSNAARGLRRRSIAYLLASEVDGFALEARGGRGKEGDPLALGIRRTQNVRGRKIYLESTPAEKPSRICREYDRTDMREYRVPCPHCGYYQTLKWANLEWNKQDLRSTVYRCGDFERQADGTTRRAAGCGEAIHEHHKPAMLAGGRWIRRHPDRPRSIVGFFIWAGYSPFVTWERLVTEWLGVQGDRTQLKAFVNTVLGEEWEETGTEMDHQELAARREQYRAEVPAPVGLLTLGVDVQGDRLEASVWGWAADEEAYVITHEVLVGNPGQAQVWSHLDLLLGRAWEHEAGRTMPIQSTCIDSGGHHTDEVYAFCRARQRANVFAIKGSSVPGAQAVGKMTALPGGGRLFVLGTDALKDSFSARLAVLTAGPRYVHFAWHLPDEYFTQLTAETARPRYINRRLVRRWELRAGQRNEALDTGVYALAALYILGPTVRGALGQLAERIARGQSAPAFPTRRGQRRVRSRGVGPG